MKSAEENLLEGLPTKFTATGSDVTIEVRGPYRMSCAQIAFVTRETQYERETKTLVEVSPSDNVPLAIAVLGTGRVTLDVEEDARKYAEEALNYGSSEDEIIEEALMKLRAIMLLREHRAEAADLLKKASEKQMQDAYALYLLSHEDGTEVLESVEEFARTTESGMWSSRLDWLRATTGKALS